MEMHAPPADQAPIADSSFEAEPLLSQSALDQTEETAAWAVALAAWLHVPDDELPQAPTPEPARIDADMTTTWIEVPPQPSSDWWI